MAVRALANQLITDLQSNWKKTALLGILLTIGFCFWIPLLVRTFGGTATSQVHTPDQDVAAVIATPPSSIRVNATATASALTTFDWKKADEMLAGDPILQSVKIAFIEADPFQIDGSQFPPPILFADEPITPHVSPADRVPRVEKEQPPLVDVATTRETVSGIALTSTIIGANRRAALINGQLYRVGQTLDVDGESFTVMQIDSSRVALTQDSQVFELTIRRSTDRSNSRSNSNSN